MARKGLKRVRFNYEGKTYERTGKTMAEAHRKAAELRYRLERGENVISGNMTVKAWADTWRETYVTPNVGVAHDRNTGIYLKKITDEIGTLRLRHVTDIHLLQIINNDASKSDSLRTKLRLVINGLFRQAADSKLIPANPAGFKKDKGEKNRRRRSEGARKSGKRRSITKTERKHILALAQTHDAGLWLMIMLYAGLRPCECRALDWRHVDFKKKLIHVEDSMKSGTMEIGDPKSEAGIRDIPMKDELISFLRPLRGMPFQPVLVTQSGKRFNESSMRSMWRSFRRDLDIHMGAKTEDGKITVSAIAPDLVPYCLRHTYCTDLQDAGVPINVARYLMGHSDIKLTAGIYTDTTDKALAMVARQINIKSKRFRVKRK